LGFVPGGSDRCAPAPDTAGRSGDRDANGHLEVADHECHRGVRNGHGGFQEPLTVTHQAHRERRSERGISLNPLFALGHRPGPEEEAMDPRSTGIFCPFWQAATDL